MAKKKLEFFLGIMASPSSGKSTSERVPEEASEWIEIVGGLVLVVFIRVYGAPLAPVAVGF